MTKRSAVREGGPDPVDVVCVLDLQMSYRRAIGAVGAAADDEGLDGTSTDG